MSREKLIVIGGGVGPMAGVKLQELIIENTQNKGTDQGHLEVLHISSQKIVDRTEFLLGREKSHPAKGMLRTMQIAEAAARIACKEAVCGVPCNTFHAPKIFDRFLELLDENQVKMQVLHMIEETKDLICQIAPNAKIIGLMSTTGTRKVGVYKHLLEPKGFQIVEVPQEFQDELHDSIYNREWGIKAVSPVTKRARTNFQRYSEMLIDAGAQAVILGCTEIPLALPEKEMEKVPLIDPMLALARALIREANPQKLKPLAR